MMVNFLVLCILLQTADIIVCDLYMFYIKLQYLIMCNCSKYCWIILQIALQIRLPFLALFVNIIETLNPIYSLIKSRVLLFQIDSERSTIFWSFLWLKQACACLKTESSPWLWENLINFPARYQTTFDS